MIGSIIFVYNSVQISLYIIIARNSFCMLCMHIQLPNICPVHKPYSFASIFHQPINQQGHSQTYEKQLACTITSNTFSNTWYQALTQTRTQDSYVETISNLRNDIIECNHMFRCRHMSDTKHTFHQKCRCYRVLRC
jgi:hypothetical protein